MYLQMGGDKRETDKVKPVRLFEWWLISDVTLDAVLVQERKNITLIKMIAP